MWWFYRKLSEDSARIEYSYARESREPSGIVAFIKATEEALMVRPASMDPDEFHQGRALQHLFNVKRRGFPDSATVACG